MCAARQRRAIVIGGSIGGLFAAAMLRTKGWTVDVFERVGVELAGRGAGIVTHPALLEVLEQCGAGTADLGVRVDQRVAFDETGAVIAERDMTQVVTSWDRLHNLTRAVIPDRHHHLGQVLERFEQRPDGVVAHFADGRAEEADVLIGADGFRSTVRGQLFPEVQPVYAGYIVWRGLADEGDLPEDIRARVFGKFAFFLPPRNEIIGYPIAGPENDLRAGHRRFNWVWYRVVDPETLADMLTDEQGFRHELSIAPPLIREEVIARMRADAERSMSPPFLTILRHVGRPFFTPIYDLASPRIAEGRVALLGDAAFVARPHVGMGVTKAAEDARVLAEALASEDDVAAGLERYHRERHPQGRIAFERGRHLGEFLMPDYRSEEEKAAWQARHNVETILRDTAIADF